MITIRPMVEEDISAARALWQVTPGITLRKADSPEALARYLARNPGCSFVAINDSGELVGVSLAGHDGRRGFLNHVVVAADFQQQGIGRQLVERCCVALKREGIEKVLLFARVENAGARTFWKKMGCGERTELVALSLVIGDDPNA